MTAAPELVKFSAYAVLIAHLLHELTHYTLAWAFNADPSMGINGLGDGWLAYVGTLEVTHADAGGFGNWAIHIAPFAVGLIVGMSYLRFGAGLPGIEVWHAVGWFVYTIVGLPNDMRFMEVDAESTV